MKTLHNFLKSIFLIFVLVSDLFGAGGSVSITATNANEGDGVTINKMVFTVTGSAGASISYATRNGTAVSGADYNATSGTVTIPSNATSATVSVDLIGDLQANEASKYFYLDITGPENSASGKGTINDDDARELTISNSSITEGDSATSTAYLRISTSATAAAPINVVYTVGTTGTTATNPDDYTTSSSTAVIAAGTGYVDIPITVVGDTKVENPITEYLKVTISNSQGVPIGTASTGTLTITDNDKYSASIAATSNNTVTEGNVGTTKNAVYTVTLDQAVLTGQTATVGYTIAGSGTHQADSSDFDTATLSGTLTFSAGETSKTITVPIKGDATPEWDETYSVTISQGTNTKIGTSAVTGTITNDDTVKISIGDVSQNEGNANNTFAFPVTLDGVSISDVDVYFSTSDGTAGSNDYTSLTNQKITITAGSVGPVYANVTVKGDSMYEGNENFTVTLSNQSSGTIYDGTATGTINNDDTAPMLSVDNNSTDETNSGTTSLKFKITQSAVSGLETKVYVTTSDNTAKVGDTDYSALSNSEVVIPAGQTVGWATVSINGDTKYEADETFTVTLSSPVNSTLSTSKTATGTIKNDDTAPTVTISPKSQNEGNSDNTMNFTVTLSAVSGVNTTVNYKTIDGSATTTDTDYTGVTAGTLTINAGNATGNAAVTIKGDNKYETNETFSVELTGATNATLHTTKTATGTIVNDDSIPSLSIADLTLDEGSGSGTTTFNLPVSLSNPSYQAISVKYSTSNGSADSGDYTSVSNQTLNFSAGSTTAQNAAVSVTKDNTYEADETFTVTLSSPSNATISDSSATATIRNDDSLTLTITPATNQSVDEGNSGTTNATYTVTLSEKPLNGDVTVVYTVSGGATNPASANDFTGDVFPTATLTFANNTTTLTQTITIPIKGETVAEQDETYNITLSSATRATISGTNPVTGTIKNDDTPMFRIYTSAVGTTTVSTTEQDSGDQTVNFNVVMTAKPAASATVNYTVAACGTNQATIGTSATNNDAYKSSLSGTLTFTTSNWNTAQSLSVKVVGDTKQENDETYCVTLSNPNSYGTLHTESQAVGTIVDDDTPVVQIKASESLDRTIAEGSSGTQTITYTVELTKTPLNNVTVDYAISGNGANQATLATASGAGVDAYRNPLSGTLTFNSTTLSQTIVVTVAGDTTPEANEGYKVTLSNVSANATLNNARKEVTQTIVNDDTNVTINDITVTEGSCGDVNGSLTVTLSHPINTALTINYNSSGGTATEGADYYSVDGGSITIPAGQTTGSIPVTIRFDDDLEPTPETFNVVISNSNSGGITYSDKTGVVTINDNQNRDITTFVDQSVTEGDSGSQNMTFSVVLCQAAGQNYTFSYETADITAEDAGGATSDGHNDYDGTLSGSFQITAGNTTGTFNIPINGDLKLEPNETFRVTVTPPSGITMGDTEAIGTINDNDNRSLSINSVNVDEGHSGNKTATLRISSTQSASVPIVVAYSTKDGTATLANNDYVSASGTATIPANQTFVDVNFSVVGDTNIEASEYFDVNISNAQGIPITTGTGRITINDDDNRTVTLSGATVTEGDENNQTLNLQVTLSSALSAARTLYYYTTDGTAKVGDNDYVGVTQAENKSITLTTATTTFYIPIQIKGDLIQESGESFQVTITSPDGLAISGSPATVTINDNDNRSLSINSISSVSEGNTGTKKKTITFSITSSASVPIVVAYSTKDGTATVANNDYVSASGTATIPANQTSVDVNVTINGDYTVEPNESFDINISNGQGVTMGTVLRSVTISDDDNRTLTLSGTTVTEGDNPTKNISLSLDLNGSSPIARTIYVTTSNGTALGGEDFNATTNLAVEIPANTDPASVPVTILGDVIGENPESFTVSITSADGFSIIGSPATVNITDDDRRILSIDSPSINEGENNSTQVFTITMDQPLTYDLNINYLTLDKTAKSVENDFNATSGTVTLQATKTQVTIPVTVYGDYTAENDEYFELNISTANIDVTSPSVNGKMTLVNDDGNLSLAGAVSMLETNSSTYQMPFEIKLSKKMNSPVIVRYWTTDGTAHVSDNDYVAVDNTVTFSPGDNSKIVYVTVKGDIKYEGDETFDFNISNAQGVTINGGGVIGTIVDDDTRSVYIDDVSSDEGDINGSQKLTFKVRLNEVSGSDANISYTVTGLTADNTDFDPVSGNVVIKAGDINSSFAVNIKGDLTFEPNETVQASITSNTIGFILGDGMAIGTIVNDDGKLSIADTQIYEGNISDSIVSVRVTLSRVSTQNINVEYQTYDDTATVSGLDYYESNGTVTIEAGRTYADINITVRGDTDYTEVNEKFFVRIINNQGVTIDDNEAVVTILTDDIDLQQIFDNQRPFALRYGGTAGNLYGNFIGTGAPISCITEDDNVTCNWNYNNKLYNANTKYLNEAGWTTYDHNNSSSAVLNYAFKSGDKIVWAGLYWQGHISSKFPSEYDVDRAGFNTVRFGLPDGTTHEVTASLIEDANETNWYGFKTSSDASEPGYRFFYQGYKDVTTLVNDAIQNSRINAPASGNVFTVGNMNVSSGKDIFVGDPKRILGDGSWGGLKYGYFGGWSLVVVYQKADESNPDEDLRNISIYDGYQYLMSTQFASDQIDITVSGFLTPASIPDGEDIDSNLLYFGGGSEKALTLESMSISDKTGTFHTIDDSLNPANNVFNGSIGKLGIKLDSTRTYNTAIDIDTIKVGQHLSTKQSSATIRLRSDWDSLNANTDQAFAGVIGFSTQLYKPQICYDFSFRQNGIYFDKEDVVEENHIPVISDYVMSGVPLEMGVYLRNKDGDFDIKGISLFTDMNVTNPALEYKLKSGADYGVSRTTVDGTSYGAPLDESGSCQNYDTGSSSDPVCYSGGNGNNHINVRVGLGKGSDSDGGAVGYTKNSAGLLAKNSSQFTRITLNPLRSISADENMSTEMKLNFYIDLGAGGGQPRYTYSLGTNIPICETNSTYLPQWGMFNVLDSANTSGTEKNNLYTQVSAKAFDASVAFYKKNETTGEFTDINSTNTTVLTEIIDAGSYYDINASCANPAGARTSAPIIVPVSSHIAPIPTQSASYYNFAVKNGAFRIWYFVDDNGTLVQNWNAFPSGGTLETNLPASGAISGLYQDGKHTLCQSSCQSSPSSKGCYECLKTLYSRALCSRDNFSIRPESIDIRLFDNNGSTITDLSTQKHLTPTQSSASEIEAGAGYTYYYDANATNHSNDLAAVSGYTRYFTTSSTGYGGALNWAGPSTGCDSNVSVGLNFNMINGATAGNALKRKQVGQYALNIYDQTWTNVDNAGATHHASPWFDTEPDCTVSSTVSTGLKKGCTISSSHTNSDAALTYRDQTIEFHPYSFDLSSIISEYGENNGTISSGSNNYLYMADINVSGNENMSLRFRGPVKAYDYESTKVTNFTHTCYAKPITFGFTRSGIVDQNLVDYQARLLDNNGTVIYDSNVTKILSNQTDWFSAPATVFGTAVLGETNATLVMNYDRNSTKPVNPSKFMFEDMNVKCQNSSDCSYFANGIDRNTSGIRELDFNVTHYYGRAQGVDSRIKTDGPNDNTAEGYVRVNFEIFCGNDGNSTCDTAKKSLLPDGLNTPHGEGRDWYKNKTHVMATGNDGEADIDGTIAPKNGSSDVNVSTTTSVSGSGITIGGTEIGFQRFGATYNGSKGYPYTILMQNNPSPWLLYTPQNSSSSVNEFGIEFYKPSNLVGQDKANTNMDTDASAVPSRRIMW